jgi:hypothetical protein
MNANEETVQLLREIRDQQREMIALATAQRAAMEEQLRRSQASVTESIALQRAAIDRAKQISWIAIPGIALCIALIVYLMVRYL